MVYNGCGDWDLGARTVETMSQNPDFGMIPRIKESTPPNLGAFTLDELEKAAPEFSGTAFYTVNNAQREREIFSLRSAFRTI